MLRQASVRSSATEKLKGMEVVVSVIVKEEDLSSINLNEFSLVELVLQPEDEQVFIKLEWPTIDGESKAVLRIVSIENSEKNLHLLAAKVISLRKYKTN